MVEISVGLQLLFSPNRVSRISRGEKKVEIFNESVTKVLSVSANAVKILTGNFHDGVK